MASDRYVILGLAHPRSPWFRSLAVWANAASIPAELVKCVSAEELRARLRSGRPHSAVIIDGQLPALDRDLVETVQRAGCCVIVVDDRRSTRDWRALGADATLQTGSLRIDAFTVDTATATLLAVAIGLASGAGGTATSRIDSNVEG